VRGYLESSQSNARKGPANENIQPDFGTYHHSTAQESEELRQMVKGLFIRAFNDLPFSQDSRLKILDIGCGIGFLSCLCAESYPKSLITAFDNFEDASLKKSSLSKAKLNAKILGFSERMKFQKKDFFEANYRRGKYDLFVSNLVFHNFGRKRLKAYERLAKWVTPKSCVLLGDLFRDYKTDLKQLSSLFGIVQEKPNDSVADGVFKILFLSEPKNRPS